MFNSPYYGAYSPQSSIDRINAINNQIAELEKMKNTPMVPSQPTAINQTFQLANGGASNIRYANAIDEVEKEIVINDTPYFSKDMSVLWVKKANGEIKTYELIEIIKKDEKDLQIEFLQAQIEELKRGMINDEPNDAVIDEPTESKKSTRLFDARGSKKK